MSQTIPRQPPLLKLEAVENCPLCECNRLRHKFDVRHVTGDPLNSWASDYGFATAPVVACRDCGFVFKSVRPLSGYLDQHYASLDEMYVQRVAEEAPGFREDFRVARSMLVKAFPQGGSILDVGCASGFFLDSLGEKWTRYGLELFMAAAEKARARGGLDIRQYDIASAEFATGSFDVVCSFDVVEHMAEPVPFFREVRRVLKPGGRLLLGTGDARSLGALFAGSRWAYLAFPEHLSFFSPRSMREALLKSGFSRVHFTRVHHGVRSGSAAKAWMRGVGKHWAVTLCGGSITRLGIFRQKTVDFQIPYFFDHMICVAR